MRNSYVGWTATLRSCRLGARTAYHPKAEVSDVDQYGRIVAVCSAGGEDLNAWMVRQGWALAYRHYSTAYVADEDAAHLAGAGIWRGTFDAPVGLATGEAAGRGSGSKPATGLKRHSSGPMRH